ncbi:hypothetical protein [Periweissella ghanensis]|uniref:hypothetical protein n=1 Tax=Periweissella ghanensis TaxID=467997 RepID=UPI001E3989E4|nr:hypothetical protein [Periweissella ghanensis]MCM0600963.1 hypothetical protein [Periweissella ghanensis]
MLVQNVQEVVCLESVKVKDAREVYALIEKNYQYLAPWFPWLTNLNSVASSNGLRL